ncbi:hypothetical protein Tco_0434587 [Tanacetum coccineum]
MTIRVNYERTPPRCNSYKIFGHTESQCLKKVTVPKPNTTSKPNVASNGDQGDGFKVVRPKGSHPRKFEGVSGIEENVHDLTNTPIMATHVDEGQLDNKEEMSTIPNVDTPVATCTSVNTSDNSHDDVEDVYDETVPLWLLNI